MEKTYTTFRWAILSYLPPTHNVIFFESDPEEEKAVLLM